MAYRDPTTGRFAKRPERRYLVSIEGQIGLLIAAVLLVCMAFAMLSHP